MKSIDDKSIDMILCDLPYGTTSCKWDVIIPFEPLWEQYKRIIKDNGAIVLTSSQPFTSALVMSNIEMFRYEWVWEKNKATRFLDAKKRPLKAHENICVFYKNSPLYLPQGLVKKEIPTINKGKRGSKEKAENGVYRFADKDAVQEYSNYPRTVIKIAVDMRPLHPTQKPIALFEYLIKTYTNEHETVLDNCAGSCTTGVACTNLNRNYILIEKEQNYCEIGQKRIDEIIR